MMDDFATADERAMLDRWQRAAFGGQTVALPFSFRLGDKPSGDLLADWQASAETSQTEDRDLRTVTLSDPQTGLGIRCEIGTFRDFPGIEWVLHFANLGSADTPIIADIQALDTAFAAERSEPCVIHHARGSNCAVTDFEPLETYLGPNALDPQGAWRGEGNPVVLGSKSGRSSDGALPFLNLEMAGARGVIVAIGWTGEWAAQLWRDDDGAVRARAGMRRTHLTLHPGEEIRSPRILLLFWDGERIRGHNMLRRLILDHYAPRGDDRTGKAPISFAVWGENRADRQVGKIAWFVENNIPIDNFWIDAGWHGDAAYMDTSNVFNSGWGSHVGNWWPNATTYPEGLGGIGKAAREAGLNFTLWLEPERVFEGTQFTRDHPRWLLGPIGSRSLYNLGIREAREALTDLVSALISEAGVTVYRQDFNMDASPFWEAADMPERVGMSEIRHIEGLYAFWDGLLSRHPGLLIDNCSSGGRRIDIETLRRSIPLWRSDYQCFKDFDPIGLQGQTHGLSLWAPLHTGCCDRPDTYALRSALGTGLVFFTPPDFEGGPEGYLTPWQAFGADWLREAILEQKRVQPYYAGDFYPLTSFSLATDAWAVWQFDRPDLREGMVLALRRQDSPFPEMLARLKALDPEAQYELTDQDSGAVWEMSGAQLATGGLSIRVSDTPGSGLIVYRRVSDE